MYLGQNFRQDRRLADQSDVEESPDQGSPTTGPPAGCVEAVMHHGMIDVKAKRV